MYVSKRPVPRGSCLFNNILGRILGRLEGRLRISCRRGTRNLLVVTSSLDHNKVQYHMEISNKKPLLEKDSRICVLRAIEAPHRPYQIYVVDYYLKQAGYINVDVVEVHKLTCDNQLKEVMNKHYDLIFNVANGSLMETKAGADVCYYLNTKCTVPFVGPTIRTLDPPREEMKRVCITNGILTPNYAFVYELKADMHKLDRLSFPMIVKHYNSSDSWDLIKESKVQNREQLQTQVKRMVERNQGALVEQFIDGHEFTCLVADNWKDFSDPIVYEPVEFIFHQEGDTFKYETLKFDNFRQMGAIPVSDPSIASKIKEMCKAFYKAMDFQSYARFDLRMDTTGKVYMLEINSIPCMFYPPNGYGSADQIVIKAPGGHTAFLENVMSAAIVRHQLKQKGWKVEYSSPMGYHCKSKKPFPKGSTVWDLSGKDIKINYLKNLGSISEGNAQIKPLPRFYLPISSNLVITSENESDNYKYLSHSKDPNCWLEELSIVARRDVQEGEVLSFDYATLYGDDWRNLLEKDQASKTDWQALIKSYGEHVSSFVKACAYANNDH